jgi:sarcosine oxidase delta subunit
MKTKPIDYAAKLSLYGKITTEHAKEVNEILNNLIPDISKKVKQAHWNEETELLVMDKYKQVDGISLCPDCNCMTKTIKGLCGKCGKPKRLDDWEKDRKEFQKLFYELNNWSSGLLNEVWDWHIKAIKQEKQRTRKAVIEEIEGKLYDNWSDVNGSWKDTHKFLNSLKEGE